MTPPDDKPPLCPSPMPWHALVAGLALGAASLDGFEQALACALVLGVAGAFFLRPRDLAVFGLGLGASFGLGAGLLHLSLPDRPRVPPAALAASLAPGKLLVSGRLDEVSPKPGGRLECRLSDLSCATGPQAQALALPGRLLLSWDQAPSPAPSPGSVLRFQAKVREADGFRNENGFDLGLRRRLDALFSRAFVRGPQAVQVVAPAAPGLLETLGALTKTAILGPPGENGRPDPGRAVLLAMVLGDVSAMDQADLDRIRRASLMHLLALSGMNVAYVLAVATGLVRLLGGLWPGLYLRLPRPRLAILACLPLLALYLALSGGAPSFLRAALMFGAVSFVLFRGRSLVALDALALACGLMVLVLPQAALGLSLRLSMGAVLGLVLLYPLWQRLVPAPAGQGLLPRAWRLAWAGLGVSLCAQLGVLPVLAESFGEVSPHLYLNVLWVPVTGLAVVAGSLGVALEYLPGLSFAGQALVGACSLVGQGLLHSLDFLDERGLLSMWRVMRPSGLQVAGYAALACCAAWSVRMSGKRLAGLLLLGASLLLGPHLWATWREARPGVEVAMLDVGQGQALLLRTPGGRKTLVDTGGLYGFDVGGMVAGLCSRLENPCIDRLILTHNDFDHVGGSASLIESGLVAEVLGNGLAPDGAFGRRLGKALDARGLAPGRLSAGDRVDLGDGAWLRVLWPARGAAVPPGNEGSLVMVLMYADRALAVLTGDATPRALDELAGQGLLPACPLVVLPHHGSGKNHSPSFLDAVRPDMAWASLGQGNSYGFPSPVVVRDLVRRGIPFFTTAWSGGLALRFAAPDAPGVLRRVVPAQASRALAPDGQPPEAREDEAGP